MKKIDLYILLMSILSVAAACSQKSVQPAEKPAENIAGQKAVAVSALPQHRIYKMKGDYADLVPVTLDNNGNLQSYPDPVDITESQKPVPLGDGWYLDRRGIGPATAFLDYTYDEYHALSKVPDQTTLKAHIKVRNGIKVIWNCGTKRLTQEEYQKLIKDGFPGCTCVLPEPPAMITKK